MGVEAMITIIDYGFARKKYSVQKSAHTWYINTSFRFRGKKVYHYTSFNHCQSLEKPRIIMGKLHLTKGRFLKKARKIIKMILSELL